MAKYGTWLINSALAEFRIVRGLVPVNLSGVRAQGIFDELFAAVRNEVGEEGGGEIGEVGCHGVGDMVYYILQVSRIQHSGSREYLLYRVVEVVFTQQCPFSSILLLFGQCLGGLGTHHHF